jgi:hypothetical protein
MKHSEPEINEASMILLENHLKKFSNIRIIAQVSSIILKLLSS